MVVWITLDVLWRGPWTRLDAHVSHTVRPWGLRHAPWPKDAVYALTMFGGRVPIVVGIGCFILAVALVRRTAQPLLRFAVALAVLTLVVYAFKWGVGRTAPQVDTLHTGGTSYPSGHVPNAILMWGLMAWVAVEYRLPVAWRRLFGVLRFLGPLCAAVGMILLDWHWLSDVVAGAALGILLLRILHLIFDGPAGRWGDFAPRPGGVTAPDPPATDVVAPAPEVTARRGLSRRRA